MQDYQPFTIAMIFVVNAKPSVNWQPLNPHLVYAGYVIPSFKFPKKLLDTNFPFVTEVILS